MLMFTTAGAAGLFLVGAQQAQAATVTAQSGDTVSELADKYGVSIDSIEKANDIDATTHLIFAGQNYEIPDGTDTTTTQAATTQQTAAQSAQATQAAQAQQQASAAQAQQAASMVQQAAQTQQAASATTSTTSTSTGSSSEEAAKAWIANKESGGSYTATNGQYYGKYQLSSSYLNGDYSAANQEAVANNYVTSRYGSWVNAQSFWQSNGWY